MNKIFKILFIVFIFLGIAILPLNQALAEKWNKQFIMIYVPKDNKYDSPMLRAIGEWQKHTKKISLMTTQRPKDLPLVEVETVFESVTGEDAQNSCEVSFSYISKYFKHARIVITANESPEILEDASKKLANDYEIYALMLKSVGKMLGVPKSEDRRSVMFEMYIEGQTILPSDIDNLRSVYGWTQKTPRTTRKNN